MNSIPSAQPTRSVAASLPPPCGDGCACSVCVPTADDPAAAYKARDREVEAHEQAHLMAAGSDASGTPCYETKIGPDGKSYRIGGHVNVSLKEDPNDPQATVQRMMRIQRAALAPASPSGQDMRVAAEAGAKMSKAMQKLSAMHAAQSKH